MTELEQEMLEALKDTVRMLRAVRFSAGLGKGQFERLLKAEAVIKKAEGKQP